MICNKCGASYSAPKGIYNEKEKRHEADPKRNRFLCEMCDKKEEE